MRLLFCLLLIGLLTSSVSASERILIFDTTVTLRSDGSVRVHERIALSSNSETVKHGITRELLNVVRGRWGRTRLPLRVMRVVVDGHTMPIYTRQINDRVSVVMGDALVDMPPGRHLFELEYEIQQLVNSTHGHDELYWNATGDRILLPIDKARITVHLPRSMTTQQVEATAYSGAYGRRDPSAKLLRTSDRTLRISTTHTQAPQEAFSVMLRWPMGLVTARSPEAGSVFGTLGLLLLITTTFGLCSYLCITHIRARMLFTNHGSDDLSSGLSPAAARFLALGVSDAKALACTIIDLAVKGVIRIQLHRRGFTLHRMAGDILDSSVEQQLILDSLLSNRSDYTVTRSYQQDVQRLLSEFTGCVKYCWKFATRSRHVLTILTLMSALVCCVTTIHLFGPFNPTWVIIYILGWSGWASIVEYQAVATMRRSSRFRLNAIESIVYAILALAPGALVWLRHPMDIGLVALFTALLCAGVVSLTFSSLPSPKGLRWFTQLAQLRREYQKILCTEGNLPQSYLGYILAVDMGRKADDYPNMEWLTLPSGHGRISPRTLCDRMAMDITQSAVQPIRPNRRRLIALCDGDSEAASQQ